MKRATGLLLALLFCGVAAGGDEDLPPGALLRLGTSRPSHAAGGSAVAWAPDGGAFLSAGHDGAIRVWDAASGRLRTEVRCPVEYAFGAAWSPDSRCFAAACRDCFVRVWEAHTGKLRWECQEHQAEAHSVAFSPDGRLLASGGTDGDARVLLWETDSGALVKALEGLSGLTMGLTFSPDGRTLAAGDYDDEGESTLRLWEVDSGKELLTIQRGSTDLCASDVVFSPDGALIAMGIENKTVGVWDAATGEACARLEGHEGDVVAVAWSPDGGVLASSAYDRKVRLWDTRSWQPLTSFTADEQVIYSLAFSPDGGTLVSAGTDARIRLWQVPEGRERWIGPGHTGEVTAVALSPDARTLASGGADGTVRAWDLGTGAERLCIEGAAGSVLALAWAGEARLVFSREGEQVIHVADAGTGKDVRLLEGHSNTALSLAVMPDGLRVLSGGRDGKICLWDLATGKCETWPERTEAIRVVTLSSDGATLAWAGGDVGVSRIVENRPGAGSCSGYGISVSALAFLPGGALLAMGGNGQEILVYSFDHAAPASGDRQLVLEGQGSSTSCLAASPDGKYLASVEAGGTTRLWEVWTGAEACRFDGRGGATCVSVGPDGRVVATGQTDSSILVWELLPPKEGDVEVAWTRLAALDARAAYEAMGVLTGAGDRGADFVAARLSPVVLDEVRLRALLVELDDDDPGVREAASEELAKIRPPADGALRAALAQAASPEVRARLEDLLSAPIDPLPVPEGEVLRVLRGIQVLERLGARAALARLAAGAPGARETREAGRALDRLEKRR